jgi:hypothetical protein
VVTGQDRLNEEERREATSSSATSVTAAVTALAASTARRRGIAAKAVRISPVLYSVLNASTPNTDGQYGVLQADEAGQQRVHWRSARGLVGEGGGDGADADGVTTAISRVQ